LRKSVHVFRAMRKNVITAFARLLRASFAAERRKRSLERDHESDGKVPFAETPREIITRMVNRLEADMKVRSIEQAAAAPSSWNKNFILSRHSFSYFRPQETQRSDKPSSHLRARVK